MKNLLKSAAILFLAGATAHGQVIIADNFNAPNAGTGFGVNSGVNSDIATRLTGTAAAGLQYINRAAKLDSAYSITGDKVQVTSLAGAGRFILSANGTDPFNFASALGSGTATPANPIQYDIRISIANNSAGIDRCSFAIGTQDGINTDWDFGFQLCRTNKTTANTRYSIFDRINTASAGTGSHVTGQIARLATDTYGTEINFLMRVTDAGAETTTFSSRVQLSLNDGATWFYDTGSDSALPNGWRFDAADRYFMWDIAPNAAVTYDNFSVELVPEPSCLALGLLAGAALMLRRRVQL